MTNFFDQLYYRVNKQYMSFLGIWPEQSLFLRCTMPFLIIMILLSVIVPELIRLHDVWGDIDRVIEGISPLVVMTVSLIKLLNGCINVGKMRKIINRISHDWEYLKDRRNAEVFRNYAARGRLVTLAYSTYMYGSMILYLILPVTPSILDILVPLNETRPKKALYEAEYGVDPDDYFIEILIHSYVTTIVTIAILVTVDTMYFVNVQHACALFKIVGTNLKLSLEGKESNENQHFKTISYCINLHKNALRSVDSHTSRHAFSCSILRRRSTYEVLNCSFADLLESNYSMPFAGIIFFYLVVMSLTAVLMVIKLGETEDMLRFACLTVAQVFSLYLNTLPGQNLMDHSLHIHSIAYEFQWYEMSTENQKLILLIMLKSKKPSVLTAGKIYVISMESYSSVMQSAISYFTVFSSMRQ